jgi:hypothetical protein
MYLMSLLIMSTIINAGNYPNTKNKLISLRELSNPKQTSPFDLVSSSALIPDWHGETLAIYSNQPQVELDFSPGACGDYSFDICHLAGKNFPPVKVYLNDKLLGETTKGDPKTLKPVISTFKTGGVILGRQNKLKFKPKVPGDIGLLYVDAKLNVYHPIPAKNWQVTSIPDTYPAKTPLEEKGQIGYPKNLKWKKLSSDSIDIDLSKQATKGTVLALTHFHKPLAFTGYRFRLTTPGPSELWINGQKKGSIKNSGGNIEILAEWHKMNWCLSQIMVKLPAGPQAKFKLESSPLAGGKFLAEIPKVLDPTLNIDNWPKGEITNGLIKATIAIPDLEKGFHRGLRFEQSGIITDLTYKGHSYFGLNADRRNPIGPDHAAGPAEEFFEPVGFNEAKVGEGFLKVGIGLYEKPLDNDFFFGAAYWRKKLFDWETKITGNQATFVQKASTPAGYGYTYTKKLILPDGKPELLIEHELINTGSKRIVTNQYNHNFISIDKKPIGPEYRVDFKFRVRPTRKFPAGVKKKGNSIWAINKTVFNPVTGCNNIKNNLVTVTHEPSGKGIKISGNFVPFRFWLFWNTRTICPEPFFHIDIAPGEKISWTRRYEFF